MTTETQEEGEGMVRVEEGTRFAWLQIIPWALAIAFGIAALSVGTAFGYGDGTPDTDPPAEEVVCDGLTGRAWGLCVAYCEANDCPGSDHPSCEVLRDKVYNVLGTDRFPCDEPGIG